MAHVRTDPFMLKTWEYMLLESFVTAVYLRQMIIKLVYQIQVKGHVNFVTYSLQRTQRIS